MTRRDSSNVLTAQKSSAHIRVSKNMFRTAKSDIIRSCCMRCIVKNVEGFVLQYIHYGYSAPMECLGPA